VENDISAYDFEGRRRAALQFVQTSYETRADVLAAVESLTSWLLTLRESDFYETAVDERLPLSFNDPERGAHAFCRRLGNNLPMDLWPEPVLQTTGVNLYTCSSSLAGYCLGRAAMRGAILRPNGSGGLGWAYQVIASYAQLLSCEGADDELGSTTQLSSATSEEIHAEARRLKLDPSRAAYFIGRDQTVAAIHASESPLSLEACDTWLVRGLPLNDAFLKVIWAICQVDLSLAAVLLDEVANPALVSACIRHHVAFDIKALAYILSRMKAIFSPSSSERSVAAWMVVLEIEDRALAKFQPNSTNVSGPQSNTLVITDVEACVGTLFEAFDARVDGHRLALEWVAHLTWRFICNGLPHATRAPGVGAYEALLLAARSNLLSRGWADPVHVWTSMGGSAFPGWPLYHDCQSTETAQLPIWLDRQGKKSYVVPLTTAALLWDGNVESAEGLANWLLLASSSLCDDIALQPLLASQQSAFPRLLARPIADLKDSADLFRALWANVEPLRLRARFMDVVDGNKYVHTCKAIICVGLGMLSYSIGRVDAATALIAELGNAVDEARYCFPDFLQKPSAELAGAFASSIAAAGMLDQATLEWLLQTYDGDDDCLAAVIANASVSGIDSKLIRNALVNTCADPSEIVARWAEWNKYRLQSVEGTSHPMLKILLDLVSGCGN
jgi:hypothetical protein